MPTDYIIRPAVGSDIAGMQRLFRDTVLTICRRNYTTEEVADWASCGDSVAHWEELLSEHHYIVAHHRRDGIIGFSSMNASGYLHAMFVHKAWQGMGVATALLTEVERMARRYEASRIRVEVSMTARPFFEKRGFVMIREQKAKANRLYLTNYAMEKIL